MGMPGQRERSARRGRPHGHGPGAQYLGQESAVDNRVCGNVERAARRIPHHREVVRPGGIVRRQRLEP